MEVKNKTPPNAVAIYVAETHDQGFYYVVYNLKTRKSWNRVTIRSSLDYSWAENWEIIAEILEKNFPANAVKSLVFTTVFQINGLLDCSGYKKLAINYGYENLHPLSDLTNYLTTELLLAKRKGKKYKLDDYVIVGNIVNVQTILMSELYLLKKQKIGWDIVKKTHIILMDDPYRKPPDAVAIYVSDTRDQGLYYVVYNLKSRKSWNRVTIRSSLDYGWEENWDIVAEILEKKFPSNVVKSVVFTLPYQIDNLLKYSGYKKLAMNYGYENLHPLSDLTSYLTTELLLAKRKGKNYKIGDHVIVGKYVISTEIIMAGELYLLKKQKIGWDIVKDAYMSYSIFNADVAIRGFETLLRNSEVSFNQIAFFILKFHPPMDKSPDIEAIVKEAIPLEKLVLNPCSDEEHWIMNADYLEISGRYLAKVYAGEEYFKDYDCFVGNVCKEKFELQAGSSTFVVPIQFKRLPCTITMNIEFKTFDGLKLSSSIRCTDGGGTGKSCHLENRAGIFSKSTTVIFSMDETKAFLCKIVSNDVKKIILFENPRQFTPQDDRPKFIFGEDYCSVNYYKDGLLRRLKDANGNTKIPFKISFDKQIYIGDAALEQPEFLMPKIDLKTIYNPSLSKQLESLEKYLFLDKNKEHNVKLNTIEGCRRLKLIEILAIFIKSILKLLEETMGNPAENLYFNIDLLELSSPNLSASMIQKLCKFLKVEGSTDEYPVDILEMNYQKSLEKANSN
uniref:Uncharacterized protein n=1 Tax=Panagrolaimus sp. JU765 TaxID=591449 RepID=A0AC34QV15_9BILA